MYCLLYLCNGESVSGVVKWMLFANMSEKLSRVWIRLIWNWLGKLSAEMSGNFAGVGVCGVVEGDGLIWVLMRAFA